MKGNEKLIQSLNDRLREELTAINQYFVHAEMCEDWGYASLKEVIKKRSISEMKHAEKLIERILFLEGQPIVSKLDKISIGKTVEKMHANDWNAEESAIKGYNESIRLAAEVGDNGTKTILEAILKDEEEHIDWLESQKDQIEQMGLQLYLAEQIG
ncbi:bacterioferritin [Geoalkalibacter halelectricus]|uniref:Bacterioferritin n=1 Tax=Geoalkalibacter halelectricus TaxID=2847045 RepID=A0ABY5ZPA3_9BACT|nr:bacterioferritin [Geoalkalibacter halelectricus]MDO3380139.1 bacterioferritin [Geoalkalibacter halelectricus]UWZ79715.1 bacterioferritin [Geoalkalibacter halelectricus]